MELNFTIQYDTEAFSEEMMGQNFEFNIDKYFVVPSISATLTPYYKDLQSALNDAAINGIKKVVLLADVTPVAPIALKDGVNIDARDYNINNGLTDNNVAVSCEVICKSITGSVGVRGLEMLNAGSNLTVSMIGNLTGGIDGGTAAGDGLNIENGTANISVGGSIIGGADMGDAPGQGVQINTGTVNLNVLGDIVGGVDGGDGAGAGLNINGGNVNVTVGGSIKGGTGTSDNGSGRGLNCVNAIVTINGNVQGGTGTTTENAVTFVSGSLTINANMIKGYVAVSQSDGNGTLVLNCKYIIGLGHAMEITRSSHTVKTFIAGGTTIITGDTTNAITISGAATLQFGGKCLSNKVISNSGGTVIGDGLTTSASATSPFLDDEVPPSSSFTVDKQIAPVGQAIQFTDQSFGLIDSRLWDFGDGTTSEAQNPTHVYSSPNSYTVSLSVTNVFGTNTITKTNYVTAVAPANIIIYSNGAWLSHGQYIQQAILDEYPALSGIAHYDNLSMAQCFEAAKQAGAKCVVSGETGSSDYKSTSQQYAVYGIFHVCASGANTPTHITGWGDSSQFDKCASVPCGAGEGAQNDVSWPCDFFDDDIDGNPNTDFESYSTGRVAGKILLVRDTLSCSMWEAVYRCAQTASSGGVWNLQNGYGKISTAAAIAFAGTIPPNPFA